MLVCSTHVQNVVGSINGELKPKTIHGHIIDTDRIMLCLYTNCLKNVNVFIYQIKITVSKDFVEEIAIFLAPVLEIK
jgi:hypothetical protein